MAPLDLTDEEFRRVAEVAKTYYDGLQKVRCPYFWADVHFNTDGFRHIRFKAWNRGRDRRDQFMRLKYLSHAPQILQLSRTVQGIQETHEWERRRRHNRWEKLLVSVIYYEFIAVIERRRFKVIVKQLPGGERIFWSIVPFWRQNEQGRRLLHTGEPAQD